MRTLRASGEPGPVPLQDASDLGLNPCSDLPTHVAGSPYALRDSLRRRTLLRPAWDCVLTMLRALAPVMHPLTKHGRFISTAFQSTHPLIISTWMGLRRDDGDDSRGPSAPSGMWILPGGSALSDSRSRPGIGVRVGRPAPRLHIGPLASSTPAALRRRSRSQELLRRNLNVAASALLLLAVAPLMIAIALAIKLTSKGPVFFTQPRVGIDRRNDDPRLPQDPRRRVDHGGRIFQIYKFRTMTHEPARTDQIWANPEDPRITPIGRVLRKYRLDELPQLLNVLKGDMNLVGPRPEQPDIFKDLRREVEGYHVRQRVLPGITGLAQVNHRYDQSLDDVKQKVEFDLEYLESCSPLKDLRIMAQTVPVVIFGKGSV